MAVNFIRMPYTLQFVFVAFGEPQELFHKTHFILCCCQEPSIISRYSRKCICEQEAESLLFIPDKRTANILFLNSHCFICSQSLYFGIAFHAQSIYLLNFPMSWSDSHQLAISILNLRSNGKVKKL